jgi:hypothetical protein
MRAGARKSEPPPKRRFRLGCVEAGLEESRGLPTTPWPAATQCGGAARVRDVDLGERGKVPNCQRFRAQTKATRSILPAQPIQNVGPDLVKANLNLDEECLYPRDYVIVNFSPLSTIKISCNNCSFVARDHHM